MVYEVNVQLTTSDNVKVFATSASDEDTDLVDACRLGDVSAFEKLVRKYDRKLFRIAQNVTHNFEDAQEVVQTAFFKAYRNLSRFQGNAKFSTWLIRIALNESLMMLRKQRAVQAEPLDIDPHGDSEGDASGSWHGRSVVMATWTPNPESVYRSVELRNILTKSLQKLRPTLRVAFVLRDIDGFSIAETSEILKLTTTAVKARVSRARMQLREELTRYFRKDAAARLTV